MPSHSRQNSDNSDVLDIFDNINDTELNNTVLRLRGGRSDDESVSGTELQGSRKRPRSQNDDSVPEHDRKRAAVARPEPRPIQEAVRFPSVDLELFVAQQLINLNQADAIVPAVARPEPRPIQQAVRLPPVELNALPYPQHAVAFNQVIRPIEYQRVQENFMIPAVGSELLGLEHYFKKDTLKQIRKYDKMVAATKTSKELKNVFMIINDYINQGVVGSNKREGHIYILDQIQERIELNFQYARTNNQLVPDVFPWESAMNEINITELPPTVDISQLNKLKNQFKLNQLIRSEMYHQMQGQLTGIQKGVHLKMQTGLLDRLNALSYPQQAVAVVPAVARLDPQRIQEVVRLPPVELNALSYPQQAEAFNQDSSHEYQRMQESFYARIESNFQDARTNNQLVPDTVPWESVINGINMGELPSTVNISELHKLRNEFKLNQLLRSEMYQNMAGILTDAQEITHLIMQEKLLDKLNALVYPQQAVATVPAAARRQNNEESESPINLQRNAKRPRSQNDDSVPEHDRKRAAVARPEPRPIQEAVRFPSVDLELFVAQQLINLNQADAIVPAVARPEPRPIQQAVRLPPVELNALPYPQHAVAFNQVIRPIEYQRVQENFMIPAVGSELLGLEHYFKKDTLKQIRKYDKMVAATKTSKELKNVFMIINDYINQGVVGSNKREGHIYILDQIQERIELNFQYARTNNQLVPDVFPWESAMNEINITELPPTVDISQLNKLKNQFKLNQLIRSEMYHQMQGQLTGIQKGVHLKMQTGLFAKLEDLINP